MKRVLQVIMPLALLAFPLISASADSLSGEEIMNKVDGRYGGDSGKQITTIKLINDRNSERVRSMLSYTKKYGEDEKTVMVFREPADVEGVGYLSYSYDERGRDDDTWLFLPAVRKSRRISGSSRNDYFMGTDFTYDDMGDRDVEEDRHEFLKEENVCGEPCWVVESTPLESGYIYSKKVSWIREDVLIPVKVEFYDRQGNLMKILESSEIEEINGVWTARRMEMNNLQKAHRTILEFDDVQFNIPVQDTLFAVATLERGRIR